MQPIVAARGAPMQVVVPFTQVTHAAQVVPPIYRSVASGEANHRQGAPLVQSPAVRTVLVIRTVVTSSALGCATTAGAIPYPVVAAASPLRVLRVSQGAPRGAKVPASAIPPPQISPAAHYKQPGQAEPAETAAARAVDVARMQEVKTLVESLFHAGEVAAQKRAGTHEKTLKAVERDLFHAGEMEVQERAGTRQEVEACGHRITQDRIPDKQQQFLASLPFLVAAARDADGWPWATVLASRTGSTGFAQTPDDHTLSVHALPCVGDVLEGSFDKIGAEVGLIAIELATRKRTCINGKVKAREMHMVAGENGTVVDSAITVGIDQLLVHCPQFISNRPCRAAPAGATPVPAPHRAAYGRCLPVHIRQRIEAADTLFLASGHCGTGEQGRACGMDVNHRGGMPGFVKCSTKLDPASGKEQTVLSFPDYSGNGFLHAIGNIVVDDRCGLLFLDFEAGGYLQLTGRAEVDWDSPAVALIPGARRLISFEVHAAVDLGDGALPLRWDPPESAAGNIRQMRVVEKVKESVDITSFVLANAKEGPLPGFRGGQHLPLEVEVPAGFAKAVAAGPDVPADAEDKSPVVVKRSYSLSSPPCRSADTYRISVKRHSQGLMSRFLHDCVQVGEVITVCEPGGEFTLDDAASGPIVLVSAGVGLTPMLTMLYELVDRGSGSNGFTLEPGLRNRPIFYVHCAQDGPHHACHGEVLQLAARAAAAQMDVRVHTAYSRPLPGDQCHDSKGRISGALIAELLGQALADADVYCCGPAVFMAQLQTDLEEHGLRPERYFYEKF
mmetsp:Transcript_134771/g.349210  ORF Transcript_134771/g.349210 Transcript_134771/m.349210 type:complete len:786 (+) Transcript_134771:52-2409(+)